MARRLDEWITRASPRLHQEPHNVGVHLLPHFVAPVVDIILGYVVEPFGRGKLWYWIQGIWEQEYSFTCIAPGPLKELGFYASRFDGTSCNLERADTNIRVMLRGSNDELPAEGDYGSLMNVFTGRFPDVELRISTTYANKYPEPNRQDDKTMSVFRRVFFKEYRPLLWDQPKHFPELDLSNTSMVPIFGIAAMKSTSRRPWPRNGLGGNHRQREVNCVGRLWRCVCVCVLTMLS